MNSGIWCHQVVIESRADPSLEILPSNQSLRCGNNFVMKTKSLVAIIAAFALILASGAWPALSAQNPPEMVPVLIAYFDDLDDLDVEDIEEIGGTRRCPGESGRLGFEDPCD